MWPFKPAELAPKNGVTNSRVDGWFNALSGHGVSSFSKSANNQFQIQILDDTTARDLWRADDIAARVIEKIPEEMFRRGFKLNMADKGDAENIMASMEGLGIIDAFIQAKEYERAYGGSAIYPVINDGQEDLTQPLNMDRIPEIENILVFEARELQAIEWYGELTDKKFGKPSVYQLSVSTEGAMAAPIQSIHESRLIVFPGIRVSRMQTSARSSWGDSVLNRVVRVLADFNVSWASAAELLNDFAQPVFKIKGLAELIAADKDDIIKARIRAVQLSRSSIRATLLDSEESFERKQTPISGLAEMLDKFSVRLSAAADMPVTLLMGQSPAGLSATGESDIRFFYDRVAGVQRKVICQLEQCVKLFMLSKNGPTNGTEPDAWSVEFNPLWSPTEKEVADTRKTTADADKIYMENQVVSPEEVRNARFGGGVYSPDLHVELEDIEDELTPEEELESKDVNTEVIDDLGTTIDANVAQSAMNGAQISSLVSIVVSVGAKEISKESAKNILTTAFPTVSPGEAEKILGPKDFVQPEPEVPVLVPDDSVPQTLTPPEELSDE